MVSVSYLLLKAFGFGCVMGADADFREIRIVKKWLEMFEKEKGMKA